MTIEAVTRMTDQVAARTTPEFVRGIAHRYGDARAVVLDDHVLTFRELDQRSSVLARGLLARGVGKGCRVGFIAGNGPDWVVWLMAITRIGAVAIPLSTFVKAAELVRVVRRSDARFLVVERRFLGHDLVERVGEALPVLAASGPELALDDAPFLRCIVSTGDDLPEWVVPRDAIERDAARFDDAFLRALESEIHAEDPAIEIYTSGITAFPKGATHTHGALMTKTHFLAAVTPFEFGSEQPIAMPMFWVGGLMMTLMPALECGAVTMCTESTSRDSRISLGTVLPKDALESMPYRDVFWGLGMTETLGPYAMGKHRRVEGYPLCPPLDELAPGWEMKVVDEAGKPVGDGETGEILVRGPNLAVALHKAPRDEAFDADGFYRTGDLGERDGARVHFVGRRGEMIKTSGANVAPAEVEMELQEFDDVDSAYVVALPDDQRGQIVAAAIVPAPGRRPDTERLRVALRRRLSSYKVPRVMVVFDRAEIPLTPSNKVHKKLLADLVRERMGSRGVSS